MDRKVFISYRTIRNEPKKRAGASPLDPPLAVLGRNGSEILYKLNLTPEGQI